MDLNMFEILLANFGVWINFSIPVVVALYFVFTNREYTWEELGIQIVATIVYVLITFSILFSSTTNLKDKEFWNSKVKLFTYFEEWTERVTYTESYSCGKSRTCYRQKTRYDYHSPYWEITTSLDEKININMGDYRTASDRFGEKEVNVIRFDQSSYGDGDKYVSRPNTIIPISQSHSYNNYVKAAKSNVIHSKVPKETLDMLVKNGKLKPYPKLFKGEFGSIRLDRVIDTTGKLNNDALEILNIMAVKIGKIKQANPILYIVNEDRGFKEALEQYWQKGRKNDITLILGVDELGLVLWSDVITYTNNTDFIVDIQNNFTGKSITNIGDVLEEFNKDILKSYIRKPMEEFAYLKENITLQWYYQLMVLLGNIIISGFITYKFLTNYNRK
jgi:hypothetical protein